MVSSNRSHHFSINITADSNVICGLSFHNGVSNEVYNIPSGNCDKLDYYVDYPGTSLFEFFEMNLEFENGKMKVLPNAYLTGNFENTHITFNISSLVDTIKIHGRTHVTAIELDNEIFGNPDEICATCTIDPNIGENVERIRYRSGVISYDICLKTLLY